jgi:hypothetical protein
MIKTTKVSFLINIFFVFYEGPMQTLRSFHIRVAVCMLSIVYNANNQKWCASEAFLVSPFFFRNRASLRINTPRGGATAAQGASDTDDSSSSSVNPVKHRKKPRFRSVNPDEFDSSSRKPVTSYTDELSDSSEALEAEIVSYDTYDAFKEDYGVAGSTLREVSLDYNFPLEFLVNSVCQLGVTPPVDCDKKLSEMLNGERIFALVEAVTTLDPAEARDRFTDKSLSDIAYEFDVSLARVFELCGELNLDLPMGIRTHLTAAAYNLIVEELEGETGIGRKPVEVRFDSRGDMGNAGMGMGEIPGFGGGGPGEFEY